MTHINPNFQREIEANEIVTRNQRVNEVVIISKRVDSKINAVFNQPLLTV